VATAALGESAAVPPPGGAALLALSAGPSAALVTTLLVLAIALGAAGLLGAWRALRAGWAPRVTRLICASAIAVTALVLVPVTGSADPQSYAAYGQMVLDGLDPYTTTPAQLGGPYGAAVEPPWENTPSVYGPIATAEQAAAARLAANNPGRAVFYLTLVNGLAFLAVGALLQRFARTPKERARAALLWSLNPLLLFELVAGAHVDTLVVAGAVAALWAARRSTIGGALITGALAGTACAIKASAALVGAGLAWTMRRNGKRLTALAAGAAAVLLPAYAIAGPHALDQLRNASNYVSFAVPWRLVTGGLDRLLGEPTSRPALRFAGLVAILALAWLFTRGLPGRNDQERAAVRTCAVLTLAWVFAATYMLPWYGGLAWALLALLPASTFDLLLLAHTTVLALAYLPGRIGLLDGPMRTALDAWKSGASPVLLLAVALGAAYAARRAAPRIGHRATRTEVSSPLG
jgi:hypothetical protein